MNDSFGGAVMMGITLFFLAIFIVLIALTLQYARAFRVKNGLINYIEEKNGIEDVDIAKDDIENYLASYSVLPSSVKIGVVNVNSDDVVAKIKYDCYYKVEYFVDWEFPLFNLKNQWVIAGESRVVSNCNAITF